MAQRKSKKRSSTTCCYCGTKVTPGYDETKAKDGSPVCNECVESMSEDEVEHLLSEESLMYL